MSDFGPVIVGSEPGEHFLSLARTKQGRIFRKQILRFGEMAHPNIPGKKLKIDENTADKLVENFKNNICPIVQVPVVDDANQHVEDPLRNIGEIIGVEKTEDGVDVILDARKHADDVGRTLIGASAFMHMDYTDTKTGKKVGPTLLHVAVTNRPYVTDLDEFKEEIAASADIDGEKDLILFSPAQVEEQKPMTKDEMIAALKKDHDLDVAALLQNSSQPDNPDQTSPSETPQDAPKPVTEEEAPKQDDPVNDEPTTEEPTPVSDEPTSTQELVSALANVLKTASPDKLELSKKDESKITTEDVANAVIEMAQDNVRLSATVQELKTKSDQLENERAEKNIDELISKGFVTPAQREGMLKLSVENPDLFKQVLPTNPIVSLSEDGVTTHEDSPSEAVQAKLDEIERLAEFAKNI